MKKYFEDNSHFGSLTKEGQIIFTVFSVAFILALAVPIVIGVIRHLS